MNLNGFGEAWSATGVLPLAHVEDKGANGSSHFTVENPGGLVLD